jgi:cytochrome c553
VPVYPLMGVCLLVLAACSVESTQDTPGLYPDKAAERADALLSRAASLSLACSGCHGGDAGDMPSIEGLSRAQLSDALRTYRAQVGGKTVMHAMMRGYTDADIEAISAYLSARAAP